VSKKPAKSEQKTKGRSVAVTVYLYLYNIISSAAWQYPLAITILHILDIDPASLVAQPQSPLVTDLLSYLPLPFTKSAEITYRYAPEWANPYLNRAATTYFVIGTAVKWIQTAAVLEIVHSLLGWVRSPLSTTLMQVASRLILVWGIADRHFSAQLNPLYASMVLAWSVTEIIRYTYYACNVIGTEPYLLLWLRYTTFYVLYPLGAGSEALEMFATLPVTMRPPRINLKEWTAGDVLRCSLYGIWWPGLWFMYTYMIKQRRKVLGRGASVTIPQKKYQ